MISVLWPRMRAAVLDVHELKEPERAFGVIEKKIDIGIGAALVAGRRTEQIQMLYAKPPQFGLAPP